jgi:GTP-dependent dephospho-CoA kinase
MDSQEASAVLADRKITPKMRLELKEPFGRLMDEAKFFTQLPRLRGSLLISVGDITTLMLLDKKTQPDIAIVDFVCKRRPINAGQKKEIEDFDAKIIELNNPPGQITKGLVEGIDRALGIAKSGKAKIYVRGEEDLAVIPAAMKSPMGTVIVYGQPDDGIVFLKLDSQLKQRAEKYYSEMEVI